jgi:hypothetical protein
LNKAAISCMKCITFCVLDCGTEADPGWGNKVILILDELNPYYKIFPGVYLSQKNRPPGIGG